MKIIALEEHTVDRAIGAATTQVANENVPYLKAFYRDDLMATPSAKQLFEMGETRLKDMDRCGIDVEVISYSNNTQWVKGSEAVTLAQNANKYLASLVREHPSRFRFFATLPWDNPVAAADEMRRTASELGAVGVLIGCVQPAISAIFFKFFRRKV